VRGEKERERVKSAEQEFEQAFVASYACQREIRDVTSVLHPTPQPPPSCTRGLSINVPRAWLPAPLSVPRLAARTLRLLANVTLCVWLSPRPFACNPQTLGASLAPRALHIVCVCCRRESGVRLMPPRTPLR
jgi:hypothetical protein